MDALTPAFSALVGFACTGGLYIWIGLAFVYFLMWAWEKFAGSSERKP